VPLIAAEKKELFASDKEGEGKEMGGNRKISLRYEEGIRKKQGKGKGGRKKDPCEELDVPLRGG